MYEPDFASLTMRSNDSTPSTSWPLTSVMIARNDPDDYGKLEEIVMVADVDGEVQRNNDVDGPIQANRKMVVYEPLAEYQLQLGRNGSRVRYGNLLIIPQGNTLVYMRPIYAAEESSGKFTLQRVVVAAGDGVGFGDSLEAAMNDLLDANPEGAVGGSPEEGPGMVVDAGWSANPQVKPDWTGGPVEGVIAPDKQARMRLVSATGLGGLEASAPPSPAMIPNNHRSYAFQWFAFAAIALIIFLLAVAKKAKDGAA